MSQFLWRVPIFTRSATAIALLCLRVFCASAQMYRVTEVPTFVSNGSGVSMARGINADGYVIGDTQTDNGFAAVLVNPSGVAKTLNFLDSLDWGGTALSINSLGHFAGTASSLIVTAASAFRYTESLGFEDLDKLPGGETSGASAINAFGVVAGWSNRGGGCTDPRCAANPGFAVRWVGSRCEAVGGLVGYSVATGINDFGEMCGYGSDVDVDTLRAYRFPADGSKAHELGALGAGGGSPNAINNSGWIVGYSALSNGTARAALWVNDSVENLGALGQFYNSIACALNNRGDIVGYSLEFGSNFPRATLFHRGGAAVDLNRFVPPGWTLQIAYGINDRGMICGWALHNGLSRGFILTPSYYFRIEKGSGSKARIHFDADFDLEYATALEGAPWTPAPELKLAIGQEFVVEVEISSEQRFYRLRKD